MISRMMCYKLVTFQNVRGQSLNNIVIYQHLQHQHLHHQHLHHQHLHHQHLHHQKSLVRDLRERFGIFLFNTEPNHKRACPDLKWINVDLKSNVKSIIYYSYVLTIYVWGVLLFGYLKIVILKVDFVALNGLFLQTHIIWSCFAALVCLIMSTLLFDLLTEGDENCHLHFPLFWTLQHWRNLPNYFEYGALMPHVQVLETNQSK